MSVLGFNVPLKIVILPTVYLYIYNTIVYWHVCFKASVPAPESLLSKCSYVAQLVEVTNTISMVMVAFYGILYYRNDAIQSAVT